jgi:hypothetical protein
MAQVTSYTAQRIMDLLGGIDEVEVKQEGLDALIAQLRLIVEGNDALQTELNNVVLPQLQQALGENDNKVNDLNDNVLPNLELTLAQNEAAIEDIRTVDLPSLTEGLANNVENLLTRPKVYVQAEAPTNPDADERDLVVGDTWFDSDDNNVQRIWNGVEWSTLNVEVHDFSLTVRKFMTSTHLIY